MENPDSTKLHMVMFPWFAYGHFIPFLHLSNKLAEKGHMVSFILPKSAQLRLEKENHHPDLIHFFPVTVPPVDGLPLGAETNSDVPFHLVNHLFDSFDKTKPQVETYLANLQPDFVVYDIAFWIPALGRRVSRGFKSVRYTVVSPVIQAFYLCPSRELEKEMGSVEALMQPPAGFPAPTVRLKRHETETVSVFFRMFGELSFYERITRSFREADAVAIRSYGEIQGLLCDYIAQQYAKPLLLTGPLLPKESPAEPIDEVYCLRWLNKFEAGSVVYCAFGSQTILPKTQFQELLLGLELTGLPFLVALKPPHGCATVEEAVPEGFTERVQGRGMVCGGWVPQLQILQHPSTGCFVSHCGLGSMWESLDSDCQIVLVPFEAEQILSARFLFEELRVAVEVERDESMWFSKEDLSKAIELVMDQASTMAAELKRNHAKLREILSSKDIEETYMNSFIKTLALLESEN